VLLRPGRLLLAVTALALLPACSLRPGEGPTGSGSEVAVTSAPGAGCPALGPDLAPTSGVLAGVNLDWERDTLADYASRLGRRPAVAVSFARFPLAAQDEEHVTAAVEQVRANGGMLLLTLEPHDGLDTVTEESAGALAALLERYNQDGVPVVVRFAHEMNGSWYPWGQQPEAYRAAFRMVADAVHRGAPGSAMMWAPNYGGGYPFTGGAHAASPGSVDHAALDTTSDGELGEDDDPYAPYYPGDDVVDWVGMSLYHWGGSYPWRDNVVPEPGKFVDQLTGRYVGAAGDESSVPDFHADYGTARGKPVAIPETAAFYRPGGGGDDELAIKRAWWGQLVDPALTADLPALRMINWFEWRKHEPEVDATVDWRATGSAEIARAYAADLPGWYLHAGEGC